MEAVIAGLSIVAVLLVGLTFRQTRKNRRLHDLISTKTTQADSYRKASEAELAELQIDRSRHLREISSLEKAKESLTDRIVELNDANGALSADSVALHNQIEQLEAAVRLRPNGGDLWGLELLRSERTWRISVATSPDGESPFNDTDNPLRLAVEIEAAALREDVGAYTSVRWEASPVDDPIRSLRILRVSQELLSEAARDPRPVELVVSDHGEQVHLVLINPDDPTSPIELRSAVASGDHIEVSDSDGLVVIS